ncbi:hypothetical protein CRI94_13175 [Longibacter salinarum]|uniref:Nudix hydrolase domain-containing protein n=1 Tax=Longibacter salinarum TaxID=1850348 RepID=A0A2A8CW65_9BACT|nr:NUDIX domain-containing protein [Longibacter salinarum]PEN12945.1 hypothetical protein CRI94_13175 [Longibacter salinarum]
MSIELSVSGHEQAYVCGFCFDSDRQTVILIEKSKPDWQAGRYNGVGGKVEPGETASEAMRREFYEEAGVELPATGDGPDVWIPFCILGWGEGEGPGDGAGQVVFFRAISDVAVRDVRTVETEPIRRIALGDVLRPGTVRSQCLPNLRWLIPLALDPDDTVVRGRIGGSLRAEPAD